jgi:uncharacterized membrane protein YeaQ/YmgE (transglycosylase-associated protein family)
MDIVWIIILGFFVGLIARAIIPGKDAAGFIVTTGLGMSGALIGATIGRLLVFRHSDQPASFVISVLGAAILLLAYKRLFISESEAN